MGHKFILTDLRFSHPRNIRVTRRVRGTASSKHDHGCGQTKTIVHGYIRLSRFAPLATLTRLSTCSQLPLKLPTDQFFSYLNDTHVEHT